MIKSFDEEKTRKAMRDFTVSFVRKTEFSPSRPMGNVAMSTIEFVLTAAFVGMLDDMRDALPKCKKWLSDAVDQKEQLGPSLSYHLSLLNEALGITIWLMDGSIDRQAWAQSVSYDQAAIKEMKIYSARDAKSRRLDHVVSMAVIGGDFDTAVFEYENSLGVKSAKVGGMVSPRTFSYMVAKEGLESPQRDRFFAWGKKVVAAKLDDWLSHGQFVDAATFVCLVYSIVGGYANAEEALLQALRDAKSAG